MHALDPERVRASFINTSVRERAAIPLPSGWDALPWSDLDYLGWRDDRRPQLGFVVVELDDAPVGILLQQSEQSPRARAQCSWCEDVQLPNDVVFRSARRAGPAGRKGDTLGTLVCSRFECSANVRRLPALAYVGFDREAERERRIASLRERVTAFARRIAE